MKLTSSTLLLVLLLALSCQPKRELNFPATNLEEAAVIPKPLETTATNSGFALDQYTKLSVVSEDKAFESVADYLTDKIEKRRCFSNRYERVCPFS